MEFIKAGIENKLFTIENDYIQYNIPTKKRYKFTDPEEQVRAETFVKIVLQYGYKPEYIDFEFKVPRRTPFDLADIVIFNDIEHKSPYIVFELKQPNASEKEFEQAIEQGFGNAVSLNAKYVVISSGIKTLYYSVLEDKPLERKQNKEANIPKFGQTETKPYKFAKNSKDDFELEKITEKELTDIFRNCHDTLWGGGKRNPSESFDELDKLIFCKIWDEKKPRKTGEPYHFQIYKGEEPTKLAERINKIYLEGREKDPEVFKDDIRLNPPEVERIVGFLQGINLNETDLDSKGKAFETFMGSFFRGEFGQYFTPRTIVKFITDVLPIKNTSKVLDTSCGSGGFLLYALDKVRKQADEYYSDKHGKDHWNFWHDFAKENLFGIEINEQIARTAKMNMIIHDDGHTNVISFDGLESIDKMQNETKNFNFQENHFDFILTNPPFGSTIKFAEHRYLEDYELGKKFTDWIEIKLKNIDPEKKKETKDSQSTEVLFIERAYKFLKEDGILAIVLPDGILTNSSLDYVREWIQEHYKILAVVSMPQTAFMATGAGVKSSVLFLKKLNTEQTIKIKASKEKSANKIYKAFEKQLLDKIKEKETIIKKGDVIIQKLEEDFVNHIEALSGSYSPRELQEFKKAEKKTLDEKIKKHKNTDEYKNWKTEQENIFNNEIDKIKSLMEEKYLEDVEIPDYPIFMAIAEDIGYDAVGKTTNKNDLPDITEQLRKYLENPDFFF